MSKRRRPRAGRAIVRRQEAPQESPEWWARQGAWQPPPPAIGGTWYGQHQPSPEEIAWFREQYEANQAREQEYDRLRAGRGERLAERIRIETAKIKAEVIQATQIKAEVLQAARIKAAQIRAEASRRRGLEKRRNRRKSSFRVAGSKIVLPTKEDLRNIALDSSLAVVGFDKPVKIHSLLTNESHHQSKLLAQADFFCNRIVETYWPAKEFSMMDWWTVPGGHMANMYMYSRLSTKRKEI